MILNPSESDPLSKDCIRRRLDAALSSFVQQVEALEAQVHAGNYADETQARDPFLNLKVRIRRANEAEKIRAETWASGSDASMPDVWPKGSLFVLLDSAPVQLDLKSKSLNIERH